MHKYTHFFDTSQLQSDIKKRSLRSGAVTLGSQAIMFIVKLGSTMVLARILSPQDYGINAMAVAITGFAGLFSNLGLSTATIQRADINHEQVSTLFWINVVIGFAITVITAAISPVVAWFYRTPEIVWVMLSLSITFTITGLSVQHSALLNRQMRFFSMAKINIASLLAGIMVAIIAGYYGFGYWALVFNSLTQVTINTLGCWLACRWIPGKPVRHAGVYSMIRFGADLVGFNVINYFARNLDNILIGRYHGSSPLGLYSKAYQLLMMPITNLRDPMTRVAMPALSRLQNDPEQYRNYYLKIVSLLAFVSMPLVAFMFVCSVPLIALLLGSQWLGASELFKILAIAAFIQPVSSTSGMVLISTGRSRLYLKLGIFGAVVTCCSFISGLSWGAKGIAAAYALANYLLLYPVLFYTFKDTCITVSDFLKAIHMPLAASFLMGGGCFFLLQQLNSIPLLAVLPIVFSASTVIYLLTFVLFPGGIDVLREYYSYTQMLYEKKKK